MQYNYQDLKDLFGGSGILKIESRKGQVISSSDEGSKLYYVTKGYVKRYWISHNGDFRIQAIYGVGDVFPLTATLKNLFDQNIYQGRETYYYEAMTEVALKVCSLDKLKQEAAKNPRLYADILYQAGRRFNSNIQRLENAALSSVYNKVAHQLTYYARKYGQQDKDSIVIPFKLSHADLAAIIGATRESVSLAVNRLKRYKLIKSRNSLICVTDLEKLEETGYS